MVTVEPTTAAGLVLQTGAAISLPSTNGDKKESQPAEVVSTTSQGGLVPGQWEASLTLARLEMDEIARKIIEKEIPPKKIVLVENGLTIIADEIPDETFCNVRVYVKVGSAYEKRSNNGIAHFIEHYLFNVLIDF